MTLSMYDVLYDHIMAKFLKFYRVDYKSPYNTLKDSIINRE